MSESALQHDRAFRRIALLAVLSVGLGLALIAMLLRDSGELRAATVLPEPVPLPTFSLQDHNGKVFNASSVRGRWSLMFFGFTNCPDICPLTLQKLVSARRQMDDGETRPDIVFVSVDPNRDGVEAVRDYTRAFGDDIIGVTGDLVEINRLTSGLGIFHARSTDADGGYSVEHSASVVLVNGDSALHAVFSAPHEADHIAHDMRELMAR